MEVVSTAILAQATEASGNPALATIIGGFVGALVAILYIRHDRKKKGEDG